MKAKQATVIFSGVALAAVLVGILLFSGNLSRDTLVVYKSATCGCCQNWADQMEAAGFQVEVRNVTNLGGIKSELGVPPRVSSCHTAVVADYVIEGHVPPAQVLRLLDERPALRGIAVGGMPIGSPGMEGPNPEPYDVMAFDAKGNTSVYASVTPEESP